MKTFVAVLAIVFALFFCNAAAFADPAPPGCGSRAGAACPWVPGMRPSGDST